MIADECERWGPARLPQPLAEAGVQIAILCSERNPLGQSSFVTHHYKMYKLNSWRQFGKTLKLVMSEWNPDLIIPCDEPVVAILHYFLKNTIVARRYLSESQISVLRRSLGSVDKLDSMVFKYQTRLLAVELNLKVPLARRVNSVAAAERAAIEFGFPVYIKKSFSWAGNGSIVCKDLMHVRSTLYSLNKFTSIGKRLMRRLMGKDWYPVNTAIEVQTHISGDSVMYSVAALDGKVLGGFSGKRLMTLGSSGPSTIVQIAENTKCRFAVEKMISAMGASGFIAFDFILCSNTGTPFLIECNPRPNQVCHLGSLIGIDLCKLLVGGLKNGNENVAECQVKTKSTVSLFPQEWLRDEDSIDDKIPTLDIPSNDFKLFNFMLNYGNEQGKSIEKLCAAISVSRIASLTKTS
jgi:hypothetical protein